MRCTRRGSMNFCGYMFERVADLPHNNSDKSVFPCWQQNHKFFIERKSNQLLDYQVILTRSNWFNIMDKAF